MKNITAILICLALAGCAFYRAKTCHVVEGIKACSSAFVLSARQLKNVNFQYDVSKGKIVFKADNVTSDPAPYLDAATAGISEFIRRPAK